MSPSAEEGLNLQKRGAYAIHHDLPFSPNRIEQRMGRLDRFGSGMPVQSFALVGDRTICDGRMRASSLIPSAQGRRSAVPQQVLERAAFATHPR